MSLLFNAFDIIWKNTDKSDAKRIASLVPPENITSLTDIPYLNDNNPHHLMNIHYPKDALTALPVIIDIHGGGWMYGDKDLNGIYCQYLASRGFIVITMSYRLVPEVTIKGQVRDIFASFKKIKTMLPSLPSDPDRIYLTGDSAGGQLAAYAAAISQNNMLADGFGVKNVFNFEKLILTSPVAYANEKGPVGLYNRMMWGQKPSFSPLPKTGLDISDLLDRVEAYPDTLLITSSGDFVARKQTHRLHDDLTARGFSSTILDYPPQNGKPLMHVFAILEPNSDAGRDCIEKTVNFIENKGEAE